MDMLVQAKINIMYSNLVYMYKVNLMHDIC